MLTIHPATTERIAASADLADPIVLCAADENYVRPLTVMLHSAAESLNPGRQLHIILLDGGIEESSLNGIRESLIDFPILIDVLRPDLAQVDDLMTSHHITHTAYLRLMAARLLPESIEKVIYLDSDVLVRDDLTEMWDMELADNYCLAVTDISCPFVDAREVKDTQTPSLQAVAQRSQSDCQLERARHRRRRQLFQQRRDGLEFKTVATRQHRSQTVRLLARQFKICVVLGSVCTQRRLRRSLGKTATALEPRCSCVSVSRSGQHSGRR